MFKTKKYYISKFSCANQYCVQRKLKERSPYEKWVLAKGNNQTRYWILFEKISNFFPDLRDLFFELPVHKSIIYPLDLIEKKNQYISQNEIGFVYPFPIQKFQIFEKAMKADKKEKIEMLRLLCNTIESLHKEKIYLMGFDIKQIFIINGKIRIRYNGFNICNRNSVYRIPDYLAQQYSDVPWILDLFSLVTIIFESIYGWKPFCGTMTSFSQDEEIQFEVFYNNFKKKIFIFEEQKKLNQIGFLREQKSIIEKWNSTDKEIQDFLKNVLMLSISKNCDETIFYEAEKLITYYENSKLF